MNQFFCLEKIVDGTVQNRVYRQRNAAEEIRSLTEEAYEPVPNICAFAPVLVLLFVRRPIQNG